MTQPCLPLQELLEHLHEVLYQYNAAGRPFDGVAELTNTVRVLEAHLYEVQSPEGRTQVMGRIGASRTERD